MVRANSCSLLSLLIPPTCTVSVGPEGGATHRQLPIPRMSRAAKEKSGKTPDSDCRRGPGRPACLLKKGFEVQIFEQAPQQGEIGAGIQQSANSVKVLFVP